MSCGKRLASGYRNVCRVLGFGVQKRVPGYPPQRLLEFSHGEHDPAVGLGPRLEIGRQQPLVAILVGQIHDDRGRFGQHEIAVDQHRDFAGRSKAKEVGAPMFAGGEIDGHEFEI